MTPLLTLHDINQMIGQRLRRRRQAISWTLKELAARLQVTHQLIQKYEMGQTAISMEMLSAIAALMGVPLDYFFQEPGAEARLPNPHRFPILMIEGDPMDASRLRAAIDASEYDAEVLAVRDGAAALQSLRDHQLPFPLPQLILLDLDPAGCTAVGHTLSERSGEVLLRQIKQDPFFSAIPVVVLSHTSSICTVRSLYQLQAGGVLLKSDEYVTFKRTVQACLEYWIQAVSLPSHHREATPLQCQAA